MVTRTHLNVKFTHTFPVLLCVDIPSLEIFVDQLLTENIITSFYDVE
jgi:hypothetical protein